MELGEAAPGLAVKVLAQVAHLWMQAEALPLAIPRVPARFQPKRKRQ